MKKIKVPVRVYLHDHGSLGVILSKVPADPKREAVTTVGEYIHIDIVNTILAELNAYKLAHLPNTAKVEKLENFIYGDKITYAY